jgi:hypothetical protein
LISIIATGVPGKMTTLSGNEEEARKHITAALVEAHQIIILDNAAEGKRIDSAALASVITSSTWTTRLLGKSEEIDLPNNAIWLITGNNISLTQELTRRSIRIRTDTGVANPNLRSKFKHKPLKTFAKVNRDKLVLSVLTLIQAWIAGGRVMDTPKSLGGFDEWLMVIGGILDAVGIEGLLDNTAILKAEADDESGMYEYFISRWWDAKRDQEVYISQIADICAAEDCLVEKISHETERGRQIKLGQVLARLRDRVYLHYKVLCNGRDRKGRTIYQLKDIEVEGQVVPLPPEEPTNLTAWPPAENTAANRQPLEPTPSPKFMKPVQQELYEDDPFTSQD